MLLSRKDDDVRALCGVGERKEVWLLGAEAGCAWAQALYAVAFVFGGKKEEPLTWLEKAVAQGEPHGMHLLARRLMRGGASSDECKARAKRLLFEASELGHAVAASDYAELCFPPYSLGWFVWMHKCYEHEYVDDIQWVKEVVVRQLKLYDGGASGRIIFEIGAHLARGHGCGKRKEELELKEASRRALQLFKQWNGAARSAGFGWIWLARREKVAKDIRLVIADMIWDDRWAWSERRDLNVG